MTATSPALAAGTDKALRYLTETRDAVVHTVAGLSEAQ